MLMITCYYQCYSLKRSHLCLCCCVCRKMGSVASRVRATARSVPSLSASSCRASSLPRAVVAWLIIVQLARLYRRRYIASLDPKHDAWRIAYILAFVEMPWISEKAQEAAIFRTFAIPSISRLLDNTQQFARAPLARSEDTEILIREFTEQHYDSQRYLLFLSQPYQAR